MIPTDIKNLILEFTPVSNRFLCHCLIIDMYWPNILLNGKAVNVRWQADGFWQDRTFDLIGEYGGVIPKCTKPINVVNKRRLLRQLEECLETGECVPSPHKVVWTRLRSDIWFGPPHYTEYHAEPIDEMLLQYRPRYRYYLKMWF